MAKISWLKQQCSKLKFRLFYCKKVCSLFSLNDFKIFLGINQKIRRLSYEKIVAALKKNQMQILVFIYNKNLDKFQVYADKFIYLWYFHWKQEVMQLDVKQKYVILGAWRSQMEYYRFLKHHGFKIYLQEEEKSDGTK